MRIIKLATVLLLIVLSFGFNSTSNSTGTTTVAKDTNFYNTKAWASQKADYDLATIKAMLNDNYWIAKGGGYHRKGSGDTKLEFSTKGIQFAPKIDISIKKFTGKGKYKLGACFDLDCSSCMVKITGANLAADVNKSYLEVTDFDVTTGLVSGNFVFYFDPATPEVNTKSNFKKTLAFEKGVFKDLKLDIY
jgi:hypothetical protein